MSCAIFDRLNRCIQSMALCACCAATADFDAPQSLCSSCWHAWWFEGWSDSELVDLGENAQYTLVVKSELSRRKAHRAQLN